MVYLNTLKDMNPKIAEVESVPLIREIRRSNTLPLYEEKMMVNFSKHLISKYDVEAMAYAADLIPRVLAEISYIAKDNPVYNPFNIERSIAMLNELLAPLQENIKYSRDILVTQDLLVSQMTVLINALKSIKSQDDMKVVNDGINQVFSAVLRNSDNFTIKYDDIVNEAEVGRIDSLMKSMNDGFYFHVKMEEELQKVDFNTLTRRLPQQDLDKVNSISKKITDIKKGIDAAYMNNMKMAHFAITFYSFIKWARS